IAMLLIALLVSGSAGLVTAATRTLVRSRLDTVAVALARSRLEQLMALPWGYGSPRAPVVHTDAVTNLSGVTPEASGTGLLSPGTSLDTNTPSFVDHVDKDGRWVGNDTVPAGGARFTRRWYARPVPGLSDLLLLRVHVLDLRGHVAPVTVSTFR